MPNSVHKLRTLGEFPLWMHNTFEFCSRQPGEVFVYSIPCDDRMHRNRELARFRAMVRSAWHKLNDAHPTAKLLRAHHWRFRCIGQHAFDIIREPCRQTAYEELRKSVAGGLTAP